MFLSTKEVSHTFSPRYDRHILPKRYLMHITPSRINSDQEQLKHTNESIAIEHKGQNTGNCNYKIVSQVIKDHVPIYNGEGDSLYKHIQGCNRARRLLREVNEKYISNVIVGRLEGIVRTLVGDSEFSTLDEYFEFLQSVFKSRRSAIDLIFELESIVQHENEPLPEYISRVLELGDEFKYQYPECVSEEHIAERFIRGLKPEIWTFRIDNTGSLNDVTKQICHESFEFEKANRSRKNIDQSHSKIPTNPINFITDICSICKGNDHKSYECPFENLNQVRCQFCKTIGHEADNCLEVYRNLANNYQKSDIECQLCHQSNHEARNCWQFVSHDEYTEQGNEYGLPN